MLQHILSGGALLLHLQSTPATLNLQHRMAALPEYTVPVCRVAGEPLQLQVKSSDVPCMWKIFKASG